jgi:RimK family alpha-L-glutamate ligase
MALAGTSPYGHGFDSHASTQDLHRFGMRFALVAHRLSETNIELVARGWPGAESALLDPQSALHRLRSGDVALNRLDVLSSLNGVEDGLWIVGQLEAHGVRVLNSASALLSAHDKLLTARLLRSAGVPHPRTMRLTQTHDASALRYPVVAKPRFGSWGLEVELCADEESLGRYLAASFGKPWGRAGAVVQELIEAAGYDLRVIVSGGRAVGCAVRRPRPGEWRANVALGATVEPAFAEPAACELAVTAARILGLDLAGVDLLPVADGHVVVEVNGAVEFRPLYAQGTDVFGDAMAALANARPLAVR